MKRIWVTEHERLYRGAPGSTSERVDGRVVLAPVHFDRVQRFDESMATSEGRQVFAWRSRYAKATQWVGVMQVPGLSLEVLPKIERPQDDFAGRESFARKNLLYMLSLTGELPIRERDVATQAVYSAPLIEALIRIFAQRLFEELGRGVEHGYVQREENLGVLRGKLLFSPHIRHNAARRERLFCGYEEFLSDTPMNRIFRAACLRLLEVSRIPGTQERLTHCLMMLDGVSDTEISAADFDKVTLNRQNERFRAVFNFCRLILTGHSPAATTGKASSFSLFFDMNVVFESYIAEMIRRHVLTGDLSDVHCYPQSRRRLRHLVYEPHQQLPHDYDPERHGKKTYALKADLLLEGRGTTMVLDTKWKTLTTKKSRQGVSGGDLLQLFAYATRYRATNNMLLYPRLEGLKEQEFHLPLSDDGLQRIQVRFVELRRDLQAERADIVDELRRLVASPFQVS